MQYHILSYSETFDSRTAVGKSTFNSKLGLDYSPVIYQD